MRQPIVPVVLAVILAACRHDQPTPPTPPAAPAPPAAPEPPTPTPASALDALDTRTPVPLLPQMAAHQKQNMREHLVAVQDIVTALGTDDFAAIESAARRIGFSEQMGAMCTHMGAAAPGFTPTALTFHHTADTIAEAARGHDRGAVLAALAATLATCTGCHATYKQQIVDEETFTRLSGGAPPMGSHGAH